jgi:hypothetical protein
MVETGQGDEAFDLILSPSFYWCKKERVGVKSTASAKKIAQSVFDGNIPAGDYKYFVRKTAEPGEFLFFAYDEDAVVDRLTRLELPLNRIRTIYFAQSEFAALETPLQVTPEAALILIDGIVSLMPVQFLSESEPLDLSAFRPSGEKVPIRTYNSMGFKASRVYTLTAGALLFALLFGIEKQYYATALSAEAERKATMLQNAGLPTTSFQLESIKKNLQKRADDVRLMKNDMETLIAITGTRSAHVASLKLDEKGMKAVFSVKGSDTKLLQEQIKKHYPHAKLSQSGQSVTIEVSR